MNNYEITKELRHYLIETALREYTTPLRPRLSAEPHYVLFCVMGYSESNQTYASVRWAARAFATYATLEELADANTDGLTLDEQILQLVHRADLLEPMRKVENFAASVWVDPVTERMQVCSRIPAVADVTFAFSEVQALVDTAPRKSADVVQLRPAQ